MKRPVGKSVSKLNALSLVLGGLLTPVAMGLSLQLLTMGAPILIYALVGGIFAFWRPEQGWRWGLWVASGVLLALAAVLAVVLVLQGRLEWSAAGITLLFAFVPALLGGCLGGTAGSMAAGGRYKAFAGVAAVLIALAVIAHAVGYAFA